MHTDCRIHLETSSVLIRQLPIEAVQTPPGWKYAPLQLGEHLTTLSPHLLSSQELGNDVRVTSLNNTIYSYAKGSFSLHLKCMLLVCCPTEKPAGENTLIRVPAGKAVLGKPDDFPSYGWDNEYGRCEMK